MSTDWRDVWKTALSAAEQAVRAREPAATRYVRRIVDARRRRLNALMLAWADGVLDQTVLEREMKRERDAVEMELLAIRGIAKRAAQDAAGAMFRAIEAALAEGIDLEV